MTTGPTLELTSGAEIRSVHVGPMDNVAYLITCRSTGVQLLIDAADEPDTLLDLVGEGSPAGLTTIVTTHRHRDHVGALSAMVEATGAVTAAGSDDADHLPVTVDRRLGDGDVIRVGEVELGVVHLRGHTPGSIALVLRDDAAGGPDHVFTGDSLFPGGLGNTHGDAAAFTSLFDDVNARIFSTLSDPTIVHPGHGAPTTIGAERPQLDEWRDRGW
ncbi:MAG: MBL fold metallo-hydrolase [Janthinobacterium lividum]